MVHWTGMIVGSNLGEAFTLWILYFTVGIVVGASILPGVSRI